ncbi:MAG: nickel/cobalt transporter [Hyphomicrobium sp.]|uniref:nickel/cobalt transporter n=1 Tax=Hyphomicrobium sp. TaxID=82 RepID=UPI003D0B1F40
MTRTLAAFGALLLMLAVSCGALAQGEAPKSPFGVPLAPGQSTAAGPQMRERSFFGDIWSYVLMQQQRINRELAGAVRQMKTGSVLDATLLLAFLSFMYGVLHAAGPGHGKAVISSYVLANEKTVRRGIMLSFLAAFFQALSAIAIVGVLAILLRATSLQITTAEKWIETASWGFVALVGIWLLYSQIAAILRRRREAAAVAHDHHAHAHTHDHGHGCGCGHDHGHDHSHAHADADGACCGHAHMPDPKQLEGPLSWSKAIAIALSVGIRPCTGAILVLIFALSQGILIAGIFATFAMALGTAITVSALASLAVGSRELATRMAGGEGRLAGAVATGAGLLGSMLVFLMGAAFFVASLGGGMAPL